MFGFKYIDKIANVMTLAFKKLQKHKSENTTLIFDICKKEILKILGSFIQNKDINEFALNKGLIRGNIMKYKNVTSNIVLIESINEVMSSLNDALFGNSTLGNSIRAYFNSNEIDILESSVERMTLFLKNLHDYRQLEAQEERERIVSEI